MRRELTRYADLTVWIRELSAPKLRTVDSAEDYRKKLLRNFSRIGELARINAGILDTYVFPLLKDDRLLTRQEIDDLLYFCDRLQDAYRMENIDVPILFKVAERLLQDADRKADEALTVRALDEFVTATYAMLELTDRFTSFDGTFLSCRDAGLKAAARLLSYLDKEHFEALPDDASREIVLVASRYVISMYQHPQGKPDPGLATQGMAVLRQALQIAKDPWYTERMPSYDWRYHVFRTLEYFSTMTEFYNEIGLSTEQLDEIYHYTGQMMVLQNTDRACYAELLSEDLQQLIWYRNACLTGQIPPEAYHKELIRLSVISTHGEPTFEESILPTLAPLEYLLSLRGKTPNAEQERTLTTFYRQIISHMHRVPKHGSFTYLLSDVLCLLMHFIDVPGAMSFENFCMCLMAAMHPPTYAHSVSVANLTACITRHLFHRQPELFTSVPGYPDEAQLVDFAWHAAACHDIGKLFILETIMTYGRDLFDWEFRWIQTHPAFGAYLLSLHEKTKPYASVAHGHHRWHDNKGGYPADFDLEQAADRIIIEIVSCADCIDASTDDIGRSYKRGRTLEDFIEELKEDGGVRYAPFMLELLEEEEVRKDLQSLLSEGRDENYRRTYRILEDVM
ncbi:MAG: HD domain-containing protein [Lachnospiraceae bacterium]|nr:HD domain-containing protein [Lachnospiraceae bacterium]